VASWPAIYCYFVPWVDAPGAPDMNGYYPGDEETAGYHAARENNALAASYEHFLRTGVPIVSFLYSHL
jgi:hypothetical protein